MAGTAAGAAVTSILAGEGSGVTSGVVSEVAGGALCCKPPAFIILRRGLLVLASNFVVTA